MLPTFLSGTAIRLILIWLFLRLISFCLGHQHTNISRCCILRSIFAASICLNSTSGSWLRVCCIGTFPGYCHERNVITPGLWGDAIWPHVVPQKEIKIWLNAVLMCSSFSALQCSAASPVIMRLSLPSASCGSSWNVLLLQQIIYCCHQNTANRAHVCPDCLLVTCFTWFGFSCGNVTAQREILSVFVQYACLEEMKRGWIYRLIVNAHAQIKVCCLIMLLDVHRKTIYREMLLNLLKITVWNSI